MPEARQDDGGRGSRARVFFALWPDDESARRLHAQALQIRAECGGRAMRRETLHLTLAFLGEVARTDLERLRAVGDLVSGEPFRFVIDRVGGWAHNRIVWAGTSEPPQPLRALAQSLIGHLAAAGFPTEQRKFTPHVTLVRKAVHRCEARAIEGCGWDVGRFVLVESTLGAEGAHYRVIGEWQLRRTESGGIVPSGPQH
ncbi:MAG: RNA 2',3'-cyclic phosphodiesterase [Rhodocyclaceae bacterium]|nr:RNA 2',3'-cyclic phosphodiesterase [Rhodocyclaceae bacterium]